jgi:hypothetical protein
MSVAEFRTTEVEMSISYRNQLRYVFIRNREYTEKQRDCTDTNA